VADARDGQPVSMARILLLALLLALVSAPSATAQDAVGEAARALAGDPVYVDAAAERALTGAEAEALRRRIEERGAGPLYVAVLPGGTFCRARHTRAWNAVPRISSGKSGWRPGAVMKRTIRSAQSAKAPSSGRNSADGNRSSSSASSVAGLSPSAVMQMPRAVAATSA